VEARVRAILISLIEEHVMKLVSMGRLAGAVGVAAPLAACGSANQAARPTKTVTITAAPSDPASTGPASAPTPDPVPTSADPAPSHTSDGRPTCLASWLHARIGGSDGAAGTVYETILLTNVSRTTCDLDGYPGVSFVSAVGGRPIGAPAVRSRVQSPVLVTLAPGESASTTVGVAQAANFPAGKCHPVSARFLRIYPPGDYGSVYVATKAEACSSRAASVPTVAAVRLAG
jgi:hypothetical protein